MMLKLSRAADLPSPGTAALEIFACDLSHNDGRRAARKTVGEPFLQELLSRKVRFVAIAIGAQGRAIVPYTEAEFIDLGADLVDFTAHAPGPVVISPCGLSPEINRRLIAGAQRRDLETGSTAGRA